MRGDTFRPLLAATVEDEGRLRFPLLASPKIDGIRCVVLGGQPLSRNLKLIRNRFVQDQMRGLPDGLDGELVVGDDVGELVFNRTTSGVMSASGSPDFRFHVFDDAFAAGPFSERLKSLRKVHGVGRALVVPHVLVQGAADLRGVEAAVLESGYEGVMLRDPAGAYKLGRSTVAEGILLKLKRFRDGEARIVGFDEGVRNTNERVTDELGLSGRSARREGMVPSGQIGTVHGVDLATGAPVTMSAGRMTRDERISGFKDPATVVGRVARYRTFDYGKVNVSRFCTFQGFRDEDDL